MDAIDEVKSLLNAALLKMDQIDSLAVSELSPSTDISLTFPALGLAGEARKSLTGRIGLEEGEVRSLEVPVGNAQNSQFSFSIGAPGSHLAVAMFLNNGFALRLVDSDGNEITPWGQRAAVVIDPANREGGFSAGSMWARIRGSNVPDVDPGEILILEIKGGRPVNTSAFLNLSYHSTGPRS